MDFDVRCKLRTFSREIVSWNLLLRLRLYYLRGVSLPTFSSELPKSGVSWYIWVLYPLT